MKQEKQEVGKKRAVGKNRSKNFKRVAHAYELRLRAVKLNLEEGISRERICEQMGVALSSLGLWIKRYRQEGEAGLRDKPMGSPAGKKKLPEPVTEKIVEIKKEQPSWGVKKIAQALGRLFWLPGSAETVRTRLHEAGLMNEPRAKGRRNMTRPRFFERATPNQLWQTDIFTFRLGGRYAYLIAFMDDYSRYVVGADLFRSATAAAVIEVYRVAMGEYQPPKEMLTDNGRQYTTWRGTSRFETELQKDRVIHIKSRPQHPMTLGKVERFWSTIWQEFLARAPFDSFEAARERIRLWVSYYNHKRPHQGIGGVCPADRYFEVATELRKAISAGVAENVLEMALRGMPRAPFYMVGRMEGQSVVLRAEKGQLKLSVEGEQQEQKELVYDLKKGQNNGQERGDKGERIEGNQGDHEKEGTSPDQPESGGPGSECVRQSAGDPGGVDRTGEGGGGLPSNGGQPDHVLPVAGSGDGGHVASLGESGEPDIRSRVKSAIAGFTEQTPAYSRDWQARNQAGAPGRRQQTRTGGGECRLNEGIQRSAITGQRDHAGPERANNGHGGSSPAGGVSKDLLRLGKTGAQCPFGRSEPAGTGTPCAILRPGQGKTSSKSCSPGGGISPGQGNRCRAPGHDRPGQNQSQPRTKAEE